MSLKVQKRGTRRESSPLLKKRKGRERNGVEKKKSVVVFLLFFFFLLSLQTPLAFSLRSLSPPSRSHSKLQPANYSCT